MINKKIIKRLGAVAKAGKAPPGLSKPSSPMKAIGKAMTTGGNTPAQRLNTLAAGPRGTKKKTPMGNRPTRKLHAY